MRLLACGPVVFILLCPPVSARAQPVRAADQNLGASIAAAARVSPTLAALIERVGTLRGLVYIAWAPALRRGIRGALLQKIQLTPDGTRCLWIAVRTGLAHDEVVPTVAHELQHAIEVLESNVRDLAGLARHFGHLATVPGHPTVETEEARRVQRQVERELRRARAPKRCSMC
jgi:hypothetical protein